LVCFSEYNNKEIQNICQTNIFIPIRSKATSNLCCARQLATASEALC
jgi:hypothetical protein